MDGVGRNKRSAVPATLLQPPIYAGTALRLFRPTCSSQTYATSRRRPDRQFRRQPALRWHVRAAGGVRHRRSSWRKTVRAAAAPCRVPRRTPVDLFARRGRLRTPGRGDRSRRRPAGVPSRRGAGGRRNDDRRRRGRCMLRTVGARLPQLPLPGLIQRAILAGQRADFALTPLPRALCVGLLTAFLPCGWLYLFASYAAGTGSPFWGAAFMAAFWLGSVPALVLAGAGARPWRGWRVGGCRWSRRWSSSRWAWPRSFSGCKRPCKPSSRGTLQTARNRSNKLRNLASRFRHAAARSGPESVLRGFTEIATHAALAVPARAV